MRPDLFSLEGRVALITGGSRGVGRMIAEGFLAQGARVYISARKADACVATAQALSGRADSHCHALPADLSTVQGCRDLAADLSKLEPGLDILVNNAGAAWAADIADFSEAGWDKVMDLNLKAPFFLTQACLPLLRSAARPDRPAKVINIGSIDGIKLSPSEMYSYQASKAGLGILTRRLAARLVREHVVVSAIAPGAFPSDMNRRARDEPGAVGERIPIGRVGATEDIAGCAVFLAARSGDYVVGDTVVVDGGIALATPYGS